MEKGKISPFTCLHLQLSLCTLTSKGPGISVPVDINTLIDNIYVSPMAPQWFADVVKDVIQKYGINKTVQYSNLDEKPFY